jgi:hypothetical protein
MSTDEKLPLDLTWQPDGHVSEVALMMMADGEHALLVEGAADHVGGCDACSMRMGAAAMISLRVTEELPAIAARHATAEARALVKPAGRPLPLRAIAAGLLVAVVSALPALFTGLPKVPALASSALKMLLIIFRSAVALVTGDASGSFGAAPLLTWLSAVLFLLAGVALARSMSRKRSLQGEVG